MYKNYVFDLYGTLADIHTDEGDPLLWEKMAEHFGRHGADYTANELREKYGEFVESAKTAVHDLYPEYEHIDIHIEDVFSNLFIYKSPTYEDVDPSDELVSETAKLFREYSREYIRLYAGIAELLHDLKKCGRVYLLTNAQRAFTWDELELLGIAEIFDGIVISSDELCCKPDIHFYKKLIKKYSLNPNETIMVGNDPNADIRGAIEAGFDTLYIHSNISPEIDYDTGCTYFIPDGNTLKMRDYLI